MSEIVLPKKKVAPETVNPRIFVLYSPPKMGKTTLLSKLDDCLILDFERGTEKLEALKIQVKDLDHLAQIGKKIKEEGKPYKYIAVDTVTKLEEWCEKRATEDYKRSPMGATFTGDNVLSLPNGAGYLWLREAFKRILAYLGTLSDNLILVGHIKDKFLEKKGKEVSAKDLDLTGKIRSITCADADAIGYMYRDEEGKMFINFRSSDEVLCGSRCQHLKGQEILIAEQAEGGDITAYWDKIYVPQ